MGDYLDTLGQYATLGNSLADKLDANGIVNDLNVRLMDVTLSYDEKLSILKNKGLEKTLDLDNYEDVELISSPDSDSGVFKSADGKEFNFRLSSGSHLYMDAIDSKSTLDSGKKSNQSVLSQQRAMSKMTGKAIEDLTEQDYNNVKNYQTRQFIDSLTNKDHKFEAYNKDQIYEPVDTSNLNLKMKIKVIGKDENGRLLVDAINPQTGRSLGFDMAQNPYLNSRFNLLGSLDTKKNRAKLEQFELAHQSIEERLQALQEKNDTDGRLMEDLDLIQSSAYQSAARLLQHIPGADNEYWSQVANAETGQQLADLATGVKKSTRQAFSKEAEKVSELIDEGDYTGAAIQAFTQMDRFFAESIPQIGLLAGGAALASVASPVIGASTAAVIGTGAIATGLTKVIQAYAGASLAGLDKTLADVEEFKKNNGRDMTKAEFAQTLAVTTATLVPEELLLGMFGNTAKGIFNRALGKTLSTATTSTGKLLAKGAGQFTLSTVGEGIQERLETATDNALTKKRDENYEGFFKESWKEWNSKEAKTAQLIGHVMGATLSSVGSSAGTSVNVHLNNKDKKHLEALQSNMRTNTVSEFNASSSSVKEGTANVEASDKLIEEVRNSKITSKSSSDEIIQEIQSLQQKISTTTDLNVQATDIARSRINDLAIETVSRMKEKADRDAFLKAIGQTTEQLFQEKVYGSNYNAELAFSNNVRLNAEEREDVRKELLQIAKDLGLSEKQAKKTLDMVNEDVRSGVKGYYSYGNTLNALIDEGKNNLNLNAADKDDLQRKQTQTAIDLVRILTNQFEKVSRFAQGANSIANERARRNQRILYPNGKKSFELKADNFIQDSYASGRGAHGVFRSAVEDVQNIQSILNNALKADPNFKKILDEVMSKTNYSLDMINEVGKFVKQYTDAIDTIQHKSFSRYQEKNNTSESKEELPPANLVNKLRRLIDSKTVLTKGNRNEYTNAIRNASEEAIAKAKELIQNGKLSEAQKEEYLDRLDEIRTGTKQTAENIKQRKEDNSKLVSQINDITSKNNIDDISKLPNTEDTLDKITKVLNDAAKLFMEFNTLSKEETEIKDNLKSFIDSLHKIRQEKILEYNKEQSKTDSQETIPNPKEFALHSGGAEGADTVWGDIAAKFGVKVNHYFHRNGKVGTLVNSEITNAELQEGMSEATKANNILKRVFPTKKAFANALIARDWIQVKHADAVFAVGNIIYKGQKNSAGYPVKATQVDGGTGWAVQMAILHDKPVYVYDQITNQWYTWNKETSTFESCDTPTLTENFAGVGTRQITDEGKLAIQEVFENTFNPNSSEIDSKSISEESEVNVQESSENLLETKSELSDESVANTTSSNILDDTKNNSVTMSNVLDRKSSSGMRFINEAVKDRYVKLTNEFKARMQPASSINSEIYTQNGIMPRLLAVVNTLKNAVENELNNNSKDVFSRFFGSKSSVGMLEAAPHYRLLYQMDVSAKNGKQQIHLTFNNDTLAAVDFSVREYLATMNLADKFDNLKNKDVAKLFGRNEEAITPEDINKLRQVIKTHGIPLTTIADGIGSLILRNLGLAINKETGTRGYYQRVASGLGMFALEYLAARDGIELTQFDSEAWINNQEKALRQAEPNADIQVTHPLFHGRNKKEQNLVNCIKIKNKKILSDLKDTYLGIPEKDVNGKFIKDEHGRPKRKESNALKNYKIERESDAKPRFNKRRISKVEYLRNTEDLVQAADVVHSVMQELTNTAYEIDSPLASWLCNDTKLVGDTGKTRKQLLKERLGWTDTAEHITYSKEDADSAEGINRSVENQIDSLIDAMKEQEKRKHDLDERAFDGIYFNWFVSSNGRLFMDSTTLNPQTNKFQRFLCLPQAVKQTFDNSNEEHIKAEAFAIAQAFDSVNTDEDIKALGERLNGFTIKQLLTLRDDLLALNTKEFKNKYNKPAEGQPKTELHIGLEGIENLGQCFNIVQHLLRKKRANGQPFETWLSIENDSTTSGYAIRFLNMPLPSMVNGNSIDSYGAKTGVFSAEEGAAPIESMHELKKLKSGDKKFLDIYKTIASDTSKYLGKYNDSVFTDFTKDTKYNTALKNTFNMMLAALPKADKDGNVTSALRSLLKPAVMTFGYTAGETSISRKLTSEIMSGKDGFIPTYLKFKQSGETLEQFASKNDIEVENLKAIVTTLDAIEKTRINPKGSLVEHLKKNAISEIYVKQGNQVKSLDAYFNDVLAPTYGKAVWEALSIAFNDYIDINNSMNNLFVATYRLFERRLNKELKQLETSNPNGISIKAYNELLEKLRPLMPTMQLAYGDKATDGQMLLMRSEKEYSNSNKVQHPMVRNGKFVQMTTSASIRTFGNPKKAGAVIPIHFIDGMTMLLTMLDTLNTTGSIGINPVHDATVMSALQGQNITRNYNKNLLVVNKEFNVYERLLNRMEEVLNKYKEDGSSVSAVPDAYNNEYLNINKLLEDAHKNVSKISNARDAFYGENRTITISNMDGQQGTAVSMSTNPNSNLYVDTRIGPRIEQTIQQENQAYAKQAKKQGSTYKGYQTTNQVYQLLQDAKTDKEARIGLLQTLQNMSWAEQSSRVASDEHMQRLETVLRRIDPKYLQDLKVQLTEGMFNAGEFNPSDNTITIAKDTGTSTSLDPVSKLAIFSTMSLAEIYAHEVTHAGLDFAFKQHLTDRLAYAKEVDLLMQVYMKAQEIFTWEDFMPKDGTYDPSLKSLYEKHAKNTYDYIFKNPDKVNLTGLKEFCAYGLTNENMVNKLSQHHLKNDTKNKNLFQKLLSAAKELLSLVFGKRSVVKGKNNTLLQDLDALTTKLSQVDNEAANTLMKHPQRALEAVSSLLGWIKDTGNTVLAPMFEWVGTAADRSGLILTSHWVSQVNGNFFDDAKLVASSALLCLFSAKRRQVLKEWMRDCIGLAQQGTIMSIMKDMTTPDMQSYRLEMLSMMTRLIDQNSKALEATVYNELAEKFGKEPLTKLEEQSLTEICLQTDLQCLLDGSMTIDDIISLVKDENALKAKIDTLEQSLKTNKNHRWFINQARALAHYMTTGIGNEVLSLNAQGIAEGRFSGKQFDTSTAELVNQIDQLATLYALASSNQDLKQVLGTLKPEGIEYFLQTHKQFVTESREGLEVTHVDGTKTWENPVNSAHIVKGYYKQLLDTSYDVKIDFADNTMQNLMAKEGYKLEYILPKNNTTGQTLAVYRRTWATPQRRDGAAFLLMGAHTMGTTLKETGYNTAEREAKYRGMGKHLWEIYKKKAEDRAKFLAGKMLNKDMTIEDIKQISDGYTPVYSPKDGSSADYRITMTHENKQKIFNPDTRGLTVLSKMFATQNSKVQTKARNLALISFLEHDMNEHMNPKHHIDKEGRGYKYIKIEQNSSNEFLKKAWTVIPQELKDAAKKAKNGFYVREDWLAELFGTPSMSLSDANTLKTNTPAGFRRGISITEYLLKVIAREVKRKIVNLPTVVIGNIVSNFNYTAIMNGQSPAKVFKMQVENADNVRKYMADKKEINRIEFRRRIGTATEAEINKKHLLEMKVERNPVYPLIQKGFYQSIVEDMNPDDLETTGVIYKFFKESKLFNKVPKLIKQIGKQAFMAEGTPIYDFLFTVTQYSDFVARATEYQIQMNKKDVPPKFTKDGKVNDDWRAYEEQVTRSILNTFINYDRPQSSLEQYLNDLGLTMFTKFAKRIQPIVNGQLTKNPMGVLSMLFMQSTIWDTESIVEQNIFSKHWSALVHNPWGNFLDAITPMPYQMYSRW